MNKHKEEKIQFWQGHFAAVETFQGSVKAYCKSQGLQLSTFYSWRKKLFCRSKPEKCSSFLPVIVRPPLTVKKEDRISALPDAQWVAEVMVHLLRGLA